MATRTPRADGSTTRMHILETAGGLFAAQGFAETTGKEICSRAGTNMAAINYHFGGRNGLYEAVLVEAHKQLVSLDDLIELAGSTTDPRLKLGTFLTHAVDMSAQPKASWGFRVLLREMLSPSQVMPALIQRAALPKAKLLRSIVGDIMGLPEDHPSVQRSLVFSVLPFLVLTLAPKDLRSRVLPAVNDTPALAQELVCYVLAGLDALAAAATEDKPVVRATAHRAAGRNARR